MIRQILSSALALTLAWVVAAPAHEDLSTPVITTEIKKDAEGKPITYMYIDGIKVHETDPAKQPLPRVVTPGTSSTPDQPGRAPSDAVVLFDGSEASLENWIGTDGEPTKWLLVDGALESVKKAGYIRSRQEFGSCQLHLEWAAPKEVKGSGQGRGNSGVFLMGRYEVQVLDSHNNETYADGQAGALYGRAKPLVNASREPGQWQTYDIVFERPEFDKNGQVTRRARFTVFHNGVLIQNHVALSGGTGWNGPHAATNYRAHGDKGPLSLQDHGNPVRYRNIWIREL